MFRYTRARARALACAAIIALPGAAQATPGYTYKATALIPFASGQGSGVATLINNRGLICGMATHRSSGFCYYKGKLRQLTPLPRETLAYPLGLNDSNQVIGESYSSGSRPQAVIYVDGAARPLSVACHLQSSAGGINHSGQIAGTFSDATTTFESILFTSKHHVVRELGSLGGPYRRGFIGGINDRGQIVGSVSMPNSDPSRDDKIAFLYQNCVMRALPIPSGYGSHAAKINQRGQAAGVIERIGTDERRPVLWDKDGMKTLLDLSGDARDVNNLGQVVGGIYSREGGFLHTPGQGARNLNELIDPAQGIRLIYPQAINDRQQIVGYGCKADLCGPVLLELLHHPHDSVRDDDAQDGPDPMRVGEL